MPKSGYRSIQKVVIKISKKPQNPFGKYYGTDFAYSTES
jgi:hypothetical protein